MDEKTGPYVVNPCEHSMAEHLRFDSKSGRIEPRTPFGNHTEYLLQLNDEASVQYRLGVLRIAKLLSSEIELKRNEISEIEHWYALGKITASDRDIEITDIKAELEGLLRTLHAQTGELPLPTLIKRKFNIPLTTP